MKMSEILIIPKNEFDEGNKFLMEHCHTTHPSGYGMKVKYSFLDFGGKLAVEWSYSGYNSNHRNGLRRDRNVKVCRLYSLTSLIDQIPWSVGLISSRMIIAEINDLKEEDSKRLDNLTMTAYEKINYKSRREHFREATSEIKDSKVSALAHAFAYHLLGRKEYADQIFMLVKHQDLFAKPK